MRNIHLDARQFNLLMGVKGCHLGVIESTAAALTFNRPQMVNLGGFEQLLRVARMAFLPAFFPFTFGLFAPGLFEWAVR